MVMSVLMSLIVPVVVVALIFGGFYYWARRQGLLTTGQAAESEPGTQRISLVTEAIAYVGVILLLAGGAVGDRPALERHPQLGACGRLRWRRRVLPPGRHHRAPGP